MERPPHNDEPPVEGTVFRFPRLWVPPDGIEPLNESPAETKASNGVGRELESPIGAPSQTERTAFEAGEFWERGDTQEFVGVASEQSPSSSTKGDSEPVPNIAELEAQPAAVDPLGTAMDAKPSTAGTDEHQFRRRMAFGRLARMRSAAVATLAVVALVGAGMALAGVTSPSQPKIHRHTSLEASRFTDRTTDADARSAVLMAASKRRRSASTPAHRKATSRHRAPPPAGPSSVTSAQPARYVEPSPATSVSTNLPQRSSPSDSSSSGTPAQPPPQTEPPRSSQSSAGAPPAHPGQFGALTCISNCG